MDAKFAPTTVLQTLSVQPLQGCIGKREVVSDKASELSTQKPGSKYCRW